MKILVGLSGGVDSAIAAYLLKEQGHDVTCLFMRNWDSALNNDVKGNPTLYDNICPQEQDFNDAKSVADTLGLKIIRKDFIKEYWDHVFESFLSDYKKGYTPNPDILCNKYIKFKSFFDYAMDNGYDYIAMGHYAKVVHEKDFTYMLKGDDTNKDQTYFLSQIPYDALRKTLFPLGEYDKSFVREKALELNLSIANKKDSTGVCFIGERNFKQFLNNYLPAKPGRVVDIETNEVIATHDGVFYYTIGQKKGLGIGGLKESMMVIDKDVTENILYLVKATDTNWIKSDACIVSGFNDLTNLAKDKVHDVTCKFRYRQKDIPVSIKFIKDDTLEVTYPNGVDAVTLGQQAVFYLDNICLGGGIIDEIYLNNVNKKDIIKEKVRNGIRDN